MRGTHIRRCAIVLPKPFAPRRERRRRMADEQKPCACQPGVCTWGSAIRVGYCKIAEHDRMQAEAEAFRWLEGYFKKTATWNLVTIEPNVPMIEAVSCGEDGTITAPTLLEAVQRAMAKSSSWRST